MGIEAPEPGALTSLPDLLAQNARAFGARPAYREKQFGIWQSWSWAEAKAEMDALALGLLELGLAPGDHLAVIGRNRPALYWAMLAAQRLRAIPVPLYPDASADELAWLLDHSGARFIVAGDQEQVDKILDMRHGLPRLARVIYLDPKGLSRYDDPLLISYSDLQAAGRRAQGHLGPELQARSDGISAQDPCVMLYTSGTTGQPKGVVLSHSNILHTARAAARCDRLGRQEEALAYLPMAWVGDFIFSVGQALACGFCINCPEAPDTVAQDRREIGPSYYFAPPAVFEALLTETMIRMEDAARPKRWLFHRALALAKRVGPARLDGARLSLWDRLAYALARLVMLEPLKAQLGLARVRVAYTAGEAIGPDLFQFYRALGVNLKQLYGQTEASVFITQQRDGAVQSDAVGTPTPGVELRIGAGGEVFYRSPGGFVEYYKNPDATRATKDDEGWIATGDAGGIDPVSGQLRIIDRAKDVGRLADGALFAPKFVENKLKFFPDIKEAVLFGDGRPFCTAFLALDLAAMGHWAEAQGIPYGSYQDLAGQDRVRARLAEHVRAVNGALATDPQLGGCQIRRFLVLHKALDADDGELTRSGKLRRGAIAAKYADLIAALYSGAPEISTLTQVTYEDGQQGQMAARLVICDLGLDAPRQVAAE